MPVEIRNASRGLVTVELNSGATIHLAPQESTGPVDDVEVEDNRWVDRLRDRGLVVVGAAEDVEPRARGRRRSAQQKGGE
jgi:hypothetical protein